MQHICSFLEGLVQVIWLKCGNTKLLPRIGLWFLMSLCTFLSLSPLPLPLPPLPALSLSFSLSFLFVCCNRNYPPGLGMGGPLYGPGPRAKLSSTFFNNSLFIFGGVGMFLPFFLPFSPFLLSLFHPFSPFPLSLPLSPSPLPFSSFVIYHFTR
jgi:hypothetical protein